MSNVTGHDGAAGDAPAARQRREADDDAAASETADVSKTEVANDASAPATAKGDGDAAEEEEDAAEGDALVDNTKLAKGEGEPTTVETETDEVSAKKKEESGKIMSKEGRSSGRVGLTTARDAAASADSRCLGYGVAFLAMATPVVQVSRGGESREASPLIHPPPATAP